MKKTMLLLLMAVFISSTAIAQDNSDVYLKQADQQDNYLPQLIEGDNFYSQFSKIPTISSLQRLAMDANQLAEIKQRGTANEATITQNGANNIGAIYVDGDRNITGLDQDGNGLLSVINIRGNANEMNVDQAGQYLQNYVQVTGNGLDMEILQNADGIQLTQYGGEGAIPLQITRQSGRVPIIINNN